ncbi:uncharacterized protein LOC116248648 isoform X1 [Nymphaea colorata]|uniref:uncharacterized protein LOC116248648 isoform X1 n=1 Tax=Nymphaea colorata TaxID=210225 RepID=UPI00129DA3DD|nr:uncharacterized protein LOC116248648 isoform X1 [Nymphaea colorata]
MVSQVFEPMRERAEICVGEIECQKKAIQLLDEFNIPRGLLPLDNIVEIGLVRSEGFIWIRQTKKKDHYFEQIGRSVSFAAEVTAFIEPRRMKKVTGVKAKELLLWIGVSEMLVDNSNCGNVQFKTHTGISRSFPVSAFLL